MFDSCQLCNLNYTTINSIQRYTIVEQRYQFCIYLNAANKPAGIILPLLRYRIPIIPPRIELVPNESATLLGFFVVWYAPYPSSVPKIKPADKLGILAVNKIRINYSF